MRSTRKFEFNFSAAPPPPKFPYTPPKPKPTKSPQPKKEDDENTKRTLTGWNRIGKINFRQWSKLVSIVDPQQEFTLVDLLAQLPPPAPPRSPPQTPPTSRPETSDPLLKEIQQTETDLTFLFRNYLELAPFFYPETEINELGVKKDKWKKDNWLEYLRDSSDINDLTFRKEQVLKIFGEVMIRHYLSTESIRGIDLFQKEHPAIWPSELDEEVEKLRNKKTKPPFNEPKPPKKELNPEEEIITNTLIILDDWNNSLNKLNFAGKEKEYVRQIIKKLSGNQGTKREQHQAVLDLLSSYSIENVRLSILLKQWEKLLTEPKKDEKSIGSWDEALDKIYNKFTKDKPTNLEKVKEFVEKELKTLPKSGIEGDIKDIEAKKEDLLKLKKGSSNMSLSSGKGEVKDFSTWTALDSNRDGNCFLNSFSLLMKGDQTLSTELRVRMCIFLMKKPELLGGFTDDEKLQALTFKLTGERDRDGKLWTLAKKGQWLATDDISILSDMLQRPVRVLYKPRNTQFKDNEAFVQFTKITGGWGKLEYYEPDTKKYKKMNYWTVCHIGDNHFEPLIPTGEDKALPPTEINKIFTKLINGANSVILGEILQSEYLMSKDFEKQLALLDKNTYQKEICERIKAIIIKKIGLKFPVDKKECEKLPTPIKVLVQKLIEVSESYKEKSPKEVEIYFEAIDAYVGGRLMLTVAPRPNDRPHIIGEAWQNEEDLVNFYLENDDPQPREFRGKELKRVFLDLETEEAQKYEQKVKNRGHNHVIFLVKGEVEYYDSSIKALNFKKGVQISIMVKFPL